MKRFIDKVALVTGGRSGIGKAIANRLASEGARVVTAQRFPDSEFDCIEADFADTSSPAKVIKTLEDMTGQLDVLVNNAGVMQEASINEMSLEDWHNSLTVNLTAPFLLVKHALPLLVKTQGVILNVGSIEALASNPLHAAYCASKAGLHGLSRAIAVDHGKDGVRCNTIAPGWIDTELNTRFIESMNNPNQFKHDIAKVHPVGRSGSVEEVAALAAFLTADESGFITGQCYTVDGGRMAQLSLP